MLQMIFKKLGVVSLIAVILVLTGCGKKDAPASIDTSQGTLIIESGSSMSVPTEGGFVPK